ncbi:MAG: hypothetical protein HY869_19670 [Chloroflexi bacterium]|nr:hypothetical protein [Chloroflexota bacterium]
MPILFFVARILSLLRLPFAVLPYLIKLALRYFLKDAFEAFWSQYSVQAVRTAGDFFNLGCTAWIFYLFLASHSPSWLALLVDISAAAECVRLITEKGIMILSAFWQALPHRRIAQWMRGRTYSRPLQRYASYYVLTDAQRLERSMRRLKALVKLRGTDQTAAKMRYVTAFRIVPDGLGLRSGAVRDVARGEIFVHAGWSSNPDLLRGIALRRSPWIFDPRYLRRPFRYRTEANHLMTLLVFENACLCPLFAIYQFGHEIKSARYEIFFQFFRWSGVEIEPTVRANGTNRPDIVARILVSGWAKATTTPRPLWRDGEVIADLDGQPLPSALAIAERYTFPVKYVREVLIPKLLAAREKILQRSIYACRSQEPHRS